MEEAKGTCCHACGHVHVKGTAHPKPYLTGKRSCERRLKEEAEGILETDQYCPQCLAEYITEHYNSLQEAEYQGRKVRLGKPMKGDVKKYKVYVKNKDGRVVKVNFGDPNLSIKRDNPVRRKAFRARHKCSQKKDRTSPAYWSCRMWSTKPVSKILSSEQKMSMGTTEPVDITPSANKTTGDVLRLLQHADISNSLKVSFYKAYMNGELSAQQTIDKINQSL